MYQKWSNAAHGKADDETFEASFPAQSWSIWYLHKINVTMLNNLTKTIININAALLILLTFHSILIFYRHSISFYSSQNVHFNLVYDYRLHA